MKELLMNQVLSVIVQAVITILVILASVLVGYLLKNVKTFKDFVISKVGANKYNQYVSIATDVYNRVEKDFRFIPKAGELKRQAFDKYLLELIPTIKQSDIDHFRQTVWANALDQVDKSGILAPAPEYDPLKDQSDVTPTTENTPSN